jgi:two-component system response regulator QseB
MEPHPYILVVEDDAAIGGLICEVLTDAGYSVRLDSTEVRTLPAIAAQPPALCLVDLYLPGRHGLEVIEHLRTHGLAPAPVVVMTTSTNDAKRARAAGVPCLDKPFDLAELLACVARYVLPQLQQVSIASSVSTGRVMTG